MSSTLGGERELVLLLSNFRRPSKERITELVSQKLDWAEVLGHLVYNRTAGLAYHVLVQSVPDSQRVNREFQFGLYSIYEFQALRTRAYGKDVAELAQLLNESGLAHAFLKGSVLAFSTYPPGCRVSNDMDVLVDSEDLTACGDLLRKAGYIQGSYRRKTGTIEPASRREIVSHRMNTGEVLPYMRISHQPGLQCSRVDVNFSLNWVPVGSGDAVRDFLANTEEYRLADGSRVRSLSREHFVAHLCVHLFKEAGVLHWVEMQRDLGLYKFVDIYSFLMDPAGEFDWPHFVKLARENNITAECYYALHATQIFFPDLADAPGFDAAIAAIRPADTAYIDEIVDGSNPDKVYRWESDLLTRFFDMKRFNQLQER